MVRWEEVPSSPFIGGLVKFGSHTRGRLDKISIDGDVVRLTLRGYERQNKHLEVDNWKLQEGELTILIPRSVTPHRSHSGRARFSTSEGEVTLYPRGQFGSILNRFEPALA
jgi:hypothetical protein